MGFLNPVFAGYAATQAKMRHFDRPCGTDQLSLKLPGTFVPGYFRSVPTGQKSFKSSPNYWAAFVGPSETARPKIRYFSAMC